jgi:hypothetical protein
MSNFYTDVIQKDGRFNSTAPCRDLMLLETATRDAVKAIIADAFNLGIDLIVTETYRSSQRQIMLFAQHATELRAVGVHHFGLACDFCKVVDGAASWAGDWSFLRDLAVKHGLISGLDWGLPGVVHTFVDPDHVQACTRDQQLALFAGTWYPALPGAAGIPEASAEAEPMAA